MAKTARQKGDAGVQTAIRLPVSLHERLKQSGSNVSEEIRRRIEESFARENSGDAATLALATSVIEFATLISLQTGHAWHAHPAANRMMRFMITARLARLRPEGEPSFKAEELPTARLVAPDSDDVEAMALALEAVEFHQFAKGRAEQ